MPKKISDSDATSQFISALKKLQMLSTSERTSDNFKDALSELDVEIPGGIMVKGKPIRSYQR